MESFKKPRYNLNHVVRETGIKADTLRAWERRYQLPQPARSEGGHRLFSDLDIATIKWLRSRQLDGMRISQAVDLLREMESSGKNPLASISENTEISSVPETNDQEPQSLSALKQTWLDSCLQYDNSTADNILSQVFAQYPLETVCAEFIFPALVTIGQLWYSSRISVQQEHFASEVVIKKIESMISGAPVTRHNQRVLIGCPQGEYHTISALVITLLLRYRGWDVLYLGANIPNDRFLETIQTTNPNLVILTATRLSTSATLFDSIQLLKGEGVPVLFGGRIFSQIPDLSRLIPGHHLGDKLTDSILQIEELLYNPKRLSIKPEIQNHLTDLHRTFLENRSLVQLTSLNKFKDEIGIPILPLAIQEASEFLIEDISAALRLGDLDLLNYNLDWIQGLIRNRNIETEELQGYLSSFSGAVIEHLGEVGKPIVEWFYVYKFIVDGVEY